MQTHSCTHINNNSVINSRHSQKVRCKQVSNCKTMPKDTDGQFIPKSFSIQFTVWLCRRRRGPLRPCPLPLLDFLAGDGSTQLCSEIIKNHKKCRYTAKKQPIFKTLMPIKLAGRILVHLVPAAFQFSWRIMRPAETAAVAAVSAGRPRFRDNQYLCDNSQYR